jgi:hypothetical protein
MMMTLAFAIAVMAQGNQPSQKFSPEKFDADLQEFITREAHLSPTEAEVFFPVYKEMQKKQRMVYGKQMSLGRQKPKDENGCKKAIQDRDELELEMKRIQQTYHAKFFDILPATKVYDVIHAEDRFHRRMLRGWHNGVPKHKNYPYNQQKEKPQR